jgi:hypothetical protein
MSRGGKRKGAGRKSGWINPDTTVIRVPKVFADHLTDIAHQLDEGTYLEPSSVKNVVVESNEKPKINSSQLVIPGSESVVSPINDLTVLSGQSLSARLGLNKAGVSNARRRFGNDERKLLNWSRGRDPDGVGWKYDEESKKYLCVNEGN